MSFIYAEKNKSEYENKIIETIDIFSDTKTTLCGAVNANWSEKERNLISTYGFIKSMIIAPTCCISFAGNNTKYAQRLLQWIFEKRLVSDEEMLDKALKLHREADKDDIEFIICSSDSGKPIISCIKERMLFKDVSSAWIGSPNAFKKMQQLRTSSKTDYMLFRRSIDECDDDSVGGFVIKSRYNGEEFYYPEWLVSDVSKPQTVKVGEDIRLFDTAENGGYTVSFRESKHDVILDFEQIDASVIYTSKYRLAEDMDNPYTQHLMLPFKFRTSNGKLL